MMLTRKQSQVLFILLVVLTMSGSISLTAHFIDHGFSRTLGSFISGWLKSWVIGTVVGFPVAIVVFPILRKFVDSLTA